MTSNEIVVALGVLFIAVSVVAFVRALVRGST